MADVAGFLYAFRIVGTDLVKIGHTKNTVAERLVALQCGQPHALELVAAVYVSGHLKRCERAVHQSLSAHHHRNEWFDLPMTQERFYDVAQEALADAIRCDGIERWNGVSITHEKPARPLCDDGYSSIVFDIPFDPVGLTCPRSLPVVYASPLSDDMV